MIENIDSDEIYLSPVLYRGKIVLMREDGYFDCGCNMIDYCHNYDSFDISDRLLSIGIDYLGHNKIMAYLPDDRRVGYRCFNHRLLLEDRFNFYFQIDVHGNRQYSMNLK